LLLMEVSKLLYFDCGNMETIDNSLSFILQG
jgi:hypothetical protein